MLQRVLVLTDGTADAEFRATGLLDALNLQLAVELQVLRLSFKELKWWLSCLPYTGLYYLKQLFTKFTFSDADTLETVRSFEEGATLVVACGQSTVPTAVELKMAFAEKVFTVFLGYPCCHCKFFDVVVAASHEILQKRRLPENVVMTEGIVNRATYRLLRHSKAYCQKHFCRIASPILVLHIGRPTWECFFDTKAVFEQICSTCKVAMDKNLVSTAVVVLSPRTPKRLVDLIRAQDWLKQWTGDFLGALAWADFVAVTADALRACSEAASSGKSLMVIGDELCQGSLVQFYTLLGAKGICKPFSFSTIEAFPNGWTYPAVHTSEAAANQVADRISGRSRANTNIRERMGKNQTGILNPASANARSLSPKTLFVQHRLTRARSFIGSFGKGAPYTNEIVVAIHTKRGNVIEALGEIRTKSELASDAMFISTRFFDGSHAS